MRLLTEVLPGAPDDRTDEPEPRPVLRNGKAHPALPGRRGTGHIDAKLATHLRQVLTALEQSQVLRRTPQRLLVTGARAGAEVSFLASSLAVTCADAGYRVLLVDANYLRPTVHQVFDLPVGDGLSTLLSGSNAPHALPQPTAIPNLAVITVGPSRPNMASLLTRERLFHRLEPLAPRFDYVMVDCGALTPIVVGRISAGADSVLVAVKEHVASVREVATIVDTLRNEGVTNPAIVMLA